MNNLFSAATFAVVFLAFAVTGVQANQVKRSKSNVSNNRGAVDQTKGEVCDDGNSNSDDCKKANKDYNAEPYVEGKMVSSPPSEPPPIAKDKAAEKADVGAVRSGIQNREASSPTVSDVVVTKTQDMIECPPGTVPSGSSGCLPVAPAPAAQKHAINTKGTGTAGRAGGDKKDYIDRDDDNDGVPTMDHAINTKGTGTAGRFGSGAGTQQNSAQMERKAKTSEVKGTVSQKSSTAGEGSGTPPPDMTPEK